MSARPLLLAILLAVPPPGSAAGAVPASRFIKAPDGTRLHCLVAGSGPGVILVPGWLMPAWVWEGQVARLSPSFTVVAPDLRSQGRSGRYRGDHTLALLASDLGCVRKSLVSGPVTLVGWSLGAQVVLEYLKLKGARGVAAVVLVDQPLSEQKPATGPASFAERYRRDPASLVRGFVRGLVVRPRPEEWYEELTADATAVPPASGLSLLRAGKRGPFLPVVAGLRVPVAYVATPALVRECEMVKAALPPARVEVYDGTGHALFLDEPDRFAALVAEMAGRKP